MERPKKGDNVLIVHPDGTELRRKILWVGDNSIEWRTGWAKISQLTLNPKIRKTKFIYKIENNED